MILVIILGLSLVFSVSTMAIPASAGRTANTLQGSSGRTQSESLQQPQDRGWPRGYSLPSEAQIVIFEPQFASWEKQTHAVAFAAVSYVAKGEKKPALGTIKIETDTQVALEQRLVKFSTLKITETNFPTLAREQVREIVTEIEKNIPDEDRIVALDRVLIQIDKSLISPKNVEGLKSDPPKIFFSDAPAILVACDGFPIWSPIKDNELKFAVNTNWDLFLHGPTGVYYLRNGKSWLRATDWNGAWSYASKLPDSFNKLPDDENWKEVKASLPGEPITKPPMVFVTAEPAELILLEGAPKFVPVPGTRLLWVSNTDSDLFSMGPDGPFYYLVAGRWFMATKLNGPWTFATPNLPEDFKLISLEHPRSRVLASVPGTQQAAEAVVLASAPQVARVNKKALQAPDVTYQGDPQYMSITGTRLQRAVNTDKEIIKVGDAYYMCYQGVWFMASTPKGPWTIATSVPEEIYQIPANSPAHSVTYVTVEQDDNEDDDWVTFAAVVGSAIK